MDFLLFFDVSSLNFTYLAADLHQFRRFHLFIFIFIFEGFTFLKEGLDSWEKKWGVISSDSKS